MGNRWKYVVLSPVTRRLQLSHSRDGLLFYFEPLMNIERITNIKNILDLIAFLAESVTKQCCLARTSKAAYQFLNRKSATFHGYQVAPYPQMASSKKEGSQKMELPIQT